jgi:hypothetical protein
MQTLEDFFPGHVDTNIKNSFNALSGRHQKEVRFVMQSVWGNRQKAMEVRGSPNRTQCSERFDEWNEEEFEWI